MFFFNKFYFILIFIILFNLFNLFNSIIFDSTLSSSFSIISNNFNILYLDKTKLKGFYCSDQIKFINITFFINFGCIFKKYHISFFTSDITGILGLGFPNKDEIIITNIFSINKINKNLKIFTIILNPLLETGLLQLGGYDMNNIYPNNGYGKVNFLKKFTLPILRDCSTHHPSINNCQFRNFRVGISKIKFGHIY